MNDYLKEIAIICGIDKNITFHLARHTFASEICLQNEVPIQTISRMLGHTDVKTTQIYAKTSDTVIRRGMAKLSERLDDFIERKKISSKIGIQKCFSKSLLEYLWKYWSFPQSVIY